MATPLWVVLSPTKAKITGSTTHPPVPLQTACYKLQTPATMVS